MMKVVLAGCGNMGYAMLSGWLKSGKLAADEIFVVEPNAELRARAEALGSRSAATPAKFRRTRCRPSIVWR